ncbi:MAG: MMPL family transporter [Methanomassiliicoccus sp.]|nr:MMPL family transporter [Methanomassiliicoccus sp.]
MVFNKIASFITKHYKLIIVVWIVALLVSVPAIMNVDNAVQYNSDFGSVDGYESIQASNIIAEQFQGTEANGSLIILLQADNISDASSRAFVLDLEKRINESQDLKYLSGVSSIYSYYSGYVLEKGIPQLGANMRPAEENVTSTAFIIWGVPAMYLANYAQSGSDSAAYAATAASLQENLTQAHADANTTQMAFGYYGAFTKAWNETSAIPDPMTRATTSVDSAAQALISSLPADQATAKAMMQGVLQGFNLTNFNDQTHVHAFTLNMIGAAAGITNNTFLQEVYDLGPTYDSGAVKAYASSIIDNGTLDTYPIAIPQELRTGFMSSDNRTMLMMLSFSVASDYVEDNGDKPLLDDVNVLRSIISDLKEETGSDITTYATGEAAISADMQASSTNDMKLIEPITIAIIIILMGVMFRSVVGQFLPLAAVGVAVGLSQALVFVIGSTIAQINSTVITMLFAVLMGVGTDYSIFIITRYREERIRGANREQAVHTSVTWAGESIVTSGATVIIAFFAMATASFSFVQTMGLLLGLSIVIALLIALTLVPAVLMLLGNRIFWPTSGKRFESFAKKLMQRKREGNHGYFHRAASFSVKHAGVVIIAAILVTVPTTYIFLTQETSFDFIGSMGDSESIDGMKAMTDDFGAGMITPTKIVVVAPAEVYNNGTFDYGYLDAIDNLTATVAADSHVQKVTSITRPYGEIVDYRNLSALSAEDRATVQAKMLEDLGKDNKTVLMNVILKDEPQSADAVGYMSELRTELSNAQAGLPALVDAKVLVGGETATMYDMSLSTSQQFANIEMLVVIGIFVVLMIVLGSLLLPAFAIVSIAMSISWAFAATTLLFGVGMGKPILWMIPLILFVMLMGIGMDYNVFILTRIREEVHKGKEIRTAVVDAVDWTGGIITALAIIMAGAFGSMMLSSNTMLQEFGFALFLAVLLDAMVVRTYIVPAAIVLMGKWAWWAPGRLQREGRGEKKGDKTKPE